MTYIIAVFKSRHATLGFASLLRSHRIPAAIINTPANLAKSCGISVKFLSDYRELAESLLAAAQRTSFVGFYLFIPNRGVLTKL